MRTVLQKSFGGLSKQYYFRQLFFGSLIAAFFLYNSTRGLQSQSIGISMLTVANALLYPYSRFVYERIVGFFIGYNIIFVNVLIVVLAKFLTIMFCWSFAAFIAPFGLAYLYFYHCKNN